MCHLLSRHVNLIPVKLSVETKAEEGSMLVEGHDGEVVVHHQTLHHTINVWDGESSLHHLNIPVFLNTCSWKTPVLLGAASGVLSWARPC